MLNIYVLIYELPYLIFSCGLTVFFLGANKNFVFAQDASAIEAFPENGQEQAHITGLRRIEDGSVISNTHTTKWRIFTDNGRELSLKVCK